MAHLRPVPEFKCELYGCEKKATQQLFNRRNAPYGRFCARHAQEMLASLERRELAGEPMPGH